MICPTCKIRIKPLEVDHNCKIIHQQASWSFPHVDMQWPIGKRKKIPQMHVAVWWMCFTSSFPPFLPLFSLSVMIQGVHIPHCVLIPAAGAKRRLNR